MRNLANAFEIITRNYYPSMKLIYFYLNFIKIKQIDKLFLEKGYENLLHFVQSI
jgi:hypothetical protein